MTSFSQFLVMLSTSSLEKFFWVQSYPFVMTAHARTQKFPWAGSGTSSWPFGSLWDIGALTQVCTMNLTSRFKSLQKNGTFQPNRQDLRCFLYCYPPVVWKFFWNKVITRVKSFLSAHVDSPWPLARKFPRRQAWNIGTDFKP
jgi:hypothetical protein